MSKPYGWMPIPESILCSICERPMKYIESEGSDTDFGHIKCICYHVYECVRCLISLRHYIPKERDE